MRKSVKKVWFQPVDEGGSCGVNRPRWFVRELYTTPHPLGALVLYCYYRCFPEVVKPPSRPWLEHLLVMKRAMSAKTGICCSITAQMSVAVLGRYLDFVI